LNGELVNPRMTRPRGRGSSRIWRLPGRFVRDLPSAISTEIQLHVPLEVQIVKELGDRWNILTIRDKGGVLRKIECQERLGGLLKYYYRNVA